MQTLRKRLNILFIITQQSFSFQAPADFLQDTIQLQK